MIYLNMINNRSENFLYNYFEESAFFYIVSILSRSKLYKVIYYFHTDWLIDWLFVVLRRIGICSTILHTDNRILLVDVYVDGWTQRIRIVFFEDLTRYYSYYVHFVFTTSHNDRIKHSPLKKSIQFCDFLSRVLNSIVYGLYPLYLFKVQNNWKNIVAHIYLLHDEIKWAP